MQTCTTCDRMQFPPTPTCTECGSGDNFEWREMSGKGKINGYCVMHDSRIRLLQADQPFNIVIVELEEDPGILMFSHLPGTPADEVPVGASVEVVFETTAGTGQKVAEWKVAG